MKNRLNTKRVFNSMALALVVTCILIGMLQRAPGPNLYTFGINSPAKGEIAISDESGKPLKTIDFEGGNKVYNFKTDKVKTIQFGFNGFSKGDSVKFQGIGYIYGEVNFFYSSFDELPGTRFIHAKYLSGSKTLVAGASDFGVAVNSKEFAVDKLSYWLKRGVCYAAVFLVISLVFYLALGKVENFAWRELIFYQAFSFLLALGLYVALKNLMDLPSRSAVKVEWASAPEDFYKVLHVQYASFEQNQLGRESPDKEFDIPVDMRLENPFRTIQIKLAKAAPAYSLAGLSIENAFFDYNIPGNQIASYFPFRNDVNVQVKDGGDGLILKPSGPNPYIQLNSEELWLYKYGDKLLFRGHVLLALAFWLFSFSLMVALQGQKRVQGIKDVWFALAFLAILFIPGTLWLMSKPVSYFVNEKRPAANADSLLVGSVSHWPGQINNYLRDHFGGRKTMITAMRTLEMKFSGEVSYSTAAVLVNGKWMFYVGEDLTSIARHTDPMGERKKLEQLKKNLLQRQYWLNKHGCKLFYAFAPIKHTVYSDKLPRSLKPVNEQSSLEKAIKYLRANTGLHIIDMKPPLMKARKEEQVYYKSDTHWNQIGAYYAYRTLMDTLNNYYPQMGEPYARERFKETHYNLIDGDLYKMLGLEYDKKREDIIFEPKFETNIKQRSVDKYKNIPVKYETIIDKNLKAPNDLKVVYLRDSYTNYLMPLLDLHSQSSYYLWTHRFSEKAFESDFPDAVVHVILERFLKDLLFENPPVLQSAWKNRPDSLKTLP